VYVSSSLPEPEAVVSTLEQIAYTSAEIAAVAAERARWPGRRTSASAATTTAATGSPWTWLMSLDTGFLQELLLP
jgi:hypothetical protein